MSSPALKTILAPVDMSDRSRAALEYACKLAKPLGAQVDVLLVQPEVVVTSHHAVLSLSERVAAARTALHRFVTDIPATHGLVVREQVESGDPRLRIVECASACAAELIVLGTHAWTGRVRALAGSIAECVVRTAPCPVVTLREPA